MAKAKKHGNPAKTSAPRLRVSQADIDGLNRAFYRADPADYFERRLREHLEYLSKSDAEHRASQGALKYKKLTSTPSSLDEDPPDESAREKFLIIESTSIRHHSAETLVRAYLAHAQNSDCPWLDMANLRAGKAFKDRVDKLAKSIAAGREDERIAVVFLGSSTESEAPIKTQEGWSETIARQADYLHLAATELLSEATAYNAVKHGMAVSAGSSSLALKGFPELAGEGPGIAALERKVSDGEATVVIAQRWVDFQLNCVVSYIFSRMIRHIWTVGKHRHHGGAPRLEELYRAPTPSAELRNHTGEASTSPYELLGYSFPPAFFDPPWSGPLPGVDPS